MILVIFIISLLLIPLYYRLFITGKLPKSLDIIQEAENIIRNSSKGELND